MEMDKKEYVITVTGKLMVENEIQRRWLELGKNLAFEKRVEQMLISACQKSNVNTVEMLKSA